MNTGNFIKIESVKTVQPTWIFRWFHPHELEDPILQQRWVCLEDGTEEWKELEHVYAK
jgi:hypothetical protein